MRILAIGLVVSAVGWTGLWFTPDQQGRRLFDRGEYQAAAEAFRDPAWQGVAWFRAGEFEKAGQAFARVATAEAEFNRGNCLVFLGKYDDAIERYDQAIEKRPDWQDPKTNREIALARAKRVEQKGGEMGNQQLGADEIVFDQNKKPGGQDTEVQGEEALSDASLQALWLRRVQTKPAQFLRAKFAYQLAVGSDKEADE